MNSQSTLLSEVPRSSQNPLLSSREFAKHCKDRFRGQSLSFVEQLQDYRSRGLLQPVFANSKTAFYSTFQTWPLWRLITYGKAADRAVQQNDKFEALLRLLIEIQDFYLPEVRGDCRVGEARDYGGSVAIGGTYFVKRATMVVSSLREWRRDCIESGDFDPRGGLAQSGMNTQEIERWIQRLWLDAGYLDPLEKWRTLLRYVSYRRRQELRYEALLAQDFREIAETLALFLHELGHRAPILTQVLLPGRVSGSADSPPQWMLTRFGKEALDNPFEMLEYIANDLGINPRPKAVILTEGEEWRALRRLFEFFGFDPMLLGIEFRSLGGHGNFSLSNWQCFVEYMHEKQVFVYFVVDREGRAAREARKLLKAKRKFKCEGLTRVIPARDRISVWRSCFESSNFTDREIATALRRQGVEMDARVIRKTRKQAGPQGLITRLASKSKIDKRRLVEDLADLLVSRRSAQESEPKRRRPVEKCVTTWGNQIALNHLPTGARSREINRKSGWLG